MKFDLSKIMKRAWEIKEEEERVIKNRKLNHNDFSPLEANTARVQAWFLAKKCGSEVSNFGDTIEILKETEKAVYGNIYYNNGMPMAIWCPKSCLC